MKILKNEVEWRCYKYKKCKGKFFGQPCEHGVNHYVSFGCTIGRCKRYTRAVCKYMDTRKEKKSR